jgi:hypothetical protein
MELVPVLVVKNPDRFHLWEKHDPVTLEQADFLLLTKVLHSKLKNRSQQEAKRYVRYFDIAVVKTPVNRSFYDFHYAVEFNKRTVSRKEIYP